MRKCCKSLCGANLRLNFMAFGTAAYSWQPGRRRNADSDSTVLKAAGTGASVRPLAVGRPKKAAKRSVMEKWLSLFTQPSAAGVRRQRTVFRRLSVSLLSPAPGRSR